MRTLTLPQVTPGDLLAACVGELTDPSKVSRLNAATPGILTSSANYHAMATAKTLHLIPQVQAVGPALGEDMRGLYKQQMSKGKGTARRYYDLIKSAAVNNKCPLCGVGTVRTLDHHLPQSKYSDLSVCPYNLVPACDYCQAGKLAKHPANAGEQTLHPYYDDFTSEQWIFGTLSTVGNPVIHFKVVAPSTWPSVDQQRVSRHFDVVKLGIVYMSNAIDDLSTMREQLVGLYTVGGAGAVHAHLDGERLRWSIRPNSWQHIMYQTLANDSWFVSGGYAHIPI